MKGAEIALVSGTRLKVGRSDECDIVLADATLPEVAFELDVAETEVTLVRAEGKRVEMRPFEVQDFGTTAIAIGPAEGEWEPLTRPEPPPPEKDESAEASSEEAAASEEPSEPSEPSEPEKPAEPEKSEEPPKKRRSILVVLLLLMLVLLGVLAALWFLWGRDVDWKNFNFEREKARVFGDTGRDDQAKSAEKAPPFDLAVLVKQYGLVLVETNGVKTLTGNLSHRAERLALRALVLANDPHVRLNLTDDETMNAAANETLFACADGAIKAVATSNHVVKLSGFAPTPEALEKVLRALDADVKGIKKIDTAQVLVGGPAPAPVADTPFVREEVGPTKSDVTALPARAPRAKRGARKQDYPIAGILTVPFPCVIMRDGSRLMEGAQIGGATLEKIAVDHLKLREGGREIEWRP